MAAMILSPYLGFDGQCEEAFRFYQTVLNGQITAMIPFGETPAASAMPADRQNAIVHARMEFGGNVLMGGDAPPGVHTGTKGVCISLVINDEAEAERVFTALAEGGTIQMPFAQTFWAHRFGMATDRFGTPWMVNCETAA